MPVGTDKFFFGMMFGVCITMAGVAVINDSIVLMIIFGFIGFLTIVGFIKYDKN